MMIGWTSKLCGIAFVINYSSHKGKVIQLDFYKSLFESLEKRGSDATGYYLERHEELSKFNKNSGLTRSVFKQPIKASDFWTEATKAKHSTSYKINGKERLVMLHTRAKTQGHESNNDNNHPIFSDNYVIVHNGCIDSEKLEGYNYKGDCDTEHILAYIETYGMVEGLKKSVGTMSIIFKHLEEDKIYLYRNTNPLELAYLPKENILIGISSKLYLPHDSGRKLNTRLFQPKMIIEELPEKHLYSISLKQRKVKCLEKIEVPTYKYSNKNNFGLDLHKDYYSDYYKDKYNAKK